MNNRDEDLLRRLARRNWITLAVFVALSTFWRDHRIVLGVLGGGLVAVVGYHWLQHALKKALAVPDSYSARRFQLSYPLRLGALAAALIVLIVVAKVNPIALIVGLSVVIINVFLIAVQRMMPTRRQ